MLNEREGGSKSTGFRVEIPDPYLLLQWAENTSNFHADSTDIEIQESFETQIAKYLQGESSLMGPNQKTWRVSFNDSFLEDLRLDFTAGYNPVSGAWKNIHTHISFKSLVKELGLHYDFVSEKAEQIAKHLASRGLKADYYLDEQDVVIEAFEPSLSGLVKIELGYNSRADAMETLAAEYSDEVDDWGIVVLVEEFPKDEKESLATIKNFQIVLSEFVDSLYVVREMEPPNIRLRLSEEDESF